MMDRSHSGDGGGSPLYLPLSQQQSPSDLTSGGHPATGRGEGLEGRSRVRIEEGEGVKIGGWLRGRASVEETALGLVYRRRWLVLFMFFCLSFVQGFCWLTFSSGSFVLLVLLLLVACGDDMSSEPASIRLSCRTIVAFLYFD